jgi:hypothetical protein
VLSVLAGAAAHDGGLGKAVVAGLPSASPADGRLPSAGGWQDGPASEDEAVWRLVRGDELLAEFVVNGGDFPWLTAAMASTSPGCPAATLLTES